MWLGGQGATVPGCPSSCHAQPHCNLWGDVVGPSGSQNLQPNASSCCASCKAHAAGTSKRACNVWVYCEDAATCKHQHRQCWLKYQANPFETPAVSGLGWSWNVLVPWVSGVVGSTLRRSRAVPSSASMVRLDTSFGSIRVQLAGQASPNATRWLQLRGATGHGSTGRFYRAEPVPTNWGDKWFFGPPYAILQGSFGGAASTPFALSGREGGLVLRRGSVILIDKGPDFLIGLASHPEWATSYTWLGDVVEEDMESVVEAIMGQPLIVQNWGSINATVLVHPVLFNVTGVSTGLSTKTPP